MFKYIDDENFCLNKSNKSKKCDCCGTSINVYTDLIYSIHDVNAICVDCIKSGKAANKFDGTFNKCEEIDNKEAMKEVETKTPTLPSFQDFFWPACCNDMCKFIGHPSKINMKDNNFWKNLSETYDDEDIPFEDLKSFSPSYLLLFQCLHCNKIRVIVDLD